MNLPAHSGATALKSRGLRLIGVLNRPAGPEKKRFPAVLFLHGFPGAEKNVDVQRRLMERGVASFAPHFSGSWGSDGRYAFSTLVPQAAVFLKFLRGLDFVDPERVAVFGFSMGGWAALNLAARAEGLRAVCAVAPVGGGEMVGRHTSGFVARACRTLRVGSHAALAKDFAAAVRKHDPAVSASRLACPILLVHGDQDGVVPAGVSKRIKAAAPKAKLVLARGANHDFLDRRAWLTRLTADWLAARL